MYRQHTMCVVCRGDKRIIGPSLAFFSKIQKRLGHLKENFGSSLKSMGNAIRDMIEIRNEKIGEVDTNRYERHGLISVSIGFNTAMVCRVV